MFTSFGFSELIIGSSIAFELFVILASRDLQRKHICSNLFGQFDIKKEFIRTVGQLAIKHCNQCQGQVFVSFLNNPLFMWAFPVLTTINSLS